jgi:hypothetical protein
MLPFNLPSLFWKRKESLLDHHAVCVSIYPPAPIIFVFLNHFYETWRVCVCVCYGTWVNLDDVLHTTSSAIVRVRVTLQLTVGQSVRHGVEPNLGLLIRDIFFLKVTVLSFLGRPLWRKVGSVICQPMCLYVYISVVARQRLSRNVTAAPDGDGWPASRPYLFTPCELSRCTHCVEGRLSPRGGHGRCEIETDLSPAGNTTRLSRL